MNGVYRETKRKTSSQRTLFFLAACAEERAIACLRLSLSICVIFSLKEVRDDAGCLLDEGCGVHVWLLKEEGSMSAMTCCGSEKREDLVEEGDVLPLAPLSRARGVRMRPSGSACPGGPGSGNQHAQQADKGREEGRQDACGQHGESGGPDHDEH